MIKIVMIISLCLILAGQAMGMAEITGGWDVVGEGPGYSAGTSELSSQGGDPTITMGISSASTLDRAGSISSTKTGDQSIDVTIMGFRLQSAYEGTVSSEVILGTRGTASAAAFIGSTATGIYTGNGSYDIYGTADLTTQGYLSGRGSGTASATGSASYGVSRVGTPSEVWGGVSGASQMSLVGNSADSLVSTGGAVNGLHADSRVTKTMRGAISSSGYSSVSAFASTLNDGRANVNASGAASSGGWEPTFAMAKVRDANENVRTFASGTVDGYVESGGAGDATDLSGVIDAYAAKGTKLSASGGASTYSSTTQSSGADRGYTNVIISDSLWGSVADTHSNGIAVEWGSAKEVRSGAITGEAGTYAISFAKAYFNTDYTTGARPVSSGNMSLQTYTEASYNKSAQSGAMLNGTGYGTMISADSAMTNSAGFEGNLFHFSHIDSGGLKAETHNIVTRAFVSSDPGGSLSLTKPFYINTTDEPDISWSSTEGWYYQTR